MELNLRKARKLEKTIETYLSEHSLKTEAQLRVQVEGEAQIQAALDQACEKVEAAAKIRQELLNARYRIREQVAKANEATGVNALIHKKALSEAMLKEVKELADVAPTSYVDVSDLIGMKKNALSKGSLPHYNESSALYASVQAVSTAVHNKHVLQVNELKREVERLDDELSQKNIGVKITLDLSTEALLKRVSLL